MAVPPRQDRNADADGKTTQPLRDVTEPRMIEDESRYIANAIKCLIVNY